MERRWQDGWLKKDAKKQKPGKAPVNIRTLAALNW